MLEREDIRLNLAGDARRRLQRMFDVQQTFFLLPVDFARAHRADTYDFQRLFLEGFRWFVLDVNVGAFFDHLLLLVAFHLGLVPLEQRYLLNVITRQEEVLIGTLHVTDRVHRHAAKDLTFVRIASNDREAVAEEKVDDVVFERLGRLAREDRPRTGKGT